MTALQPDAEKTLEAVRRRSLERRTAAKETRQEVADFGKAQARAAGAFHRKLFEQAIRSVGIDPDELDKRHEAERRSAIRFLNEQRQKTLSKAAAAKERQRLDIDALASRRQIFADPLPPAPKDPVTVLIKSADAIDLDGQGNVSISKDGNFAHTQVELSGWVSALDVASREDQATVDWHFLWTPSRNGLLDVASALGLNGYGYLYPGPGCIKGTGGWYITVRVSLTQLSESGEMVSDSVIVSVDDQTEHFEELSLGGGTIFTPTSFDSVTAVPYRNQFPAIAGSPLTITISAQLSVWVYHAETGLNFLDDGFYLNVPFVYLFLQ